MAVCVTDQETVRKGRRRNREQSSWKRRGMCAHTGLFVIFHIVIAYIAIASLAEP